MIAFLEDAYERGVLRQAGAAYPLRHERIQAQSADKFAEALPVGRRFQRRSGCAPLL